MAPMANMLPISGPPVTSVTEAIDRMQQIERALPSRDGVACFNRMYLEVTQDVNERIGQNFFSDPSFIATLDVVFANQYFDAVDAAARSIPVPAAWEPLFAERSRTDVYPIQFALAGMNAHINHDLPIAVVRTCTQLDTAPEEGTHHTDYQKVDALLDAAEQSVRESFESGVVVRADRNARTILNLVGNWSITSARDVAWDTALALWRSRSDPTIEGLIMGGVARTVAMASRCLLVSPEGPVPARNLFDRVFRSIEVLWRG